MIYILSKNRYSNQHIKYKMENNNNKKFKCSEY